MLNAKFDQSSVDTTFDRAICHTRAVAVAAVVSLVFVTSVAVADDGRGNGAQPSVAFETTAWNVIKHSDDPADFEVYLDLYPNGRFRGLARRRILALRTPKPAVRGIVATPPPRATADAVTSRQQPSQPIAVIPAPVTRPGAGRITPASGQREPQDMPSCLRDGRDTD